MMRLLKSSVLVMAMVATFSLTLTTGAHALLVLRFSDGIGAATTVNDNGPGDFNPTTGIILAAPADGVFFSLVQIATSSSPTPLLNFTSFNNASGTGTLTIELTDTNFALGATAATLISTFTLPGSIFPSTATSVTATQCADLANTPFACTPAATVNHGPFGPTTGSDITSVKTVSYTSTDPFAITERVVLGFTAPGASDFNFSSRVNQNLTLAVPQPSALLLLGLGLTGLWAIPVLRASRRGEDE